MQCHKYSSGSATFAEIISDHILIKNTQDVLDLMGAVPADGYIFSTRHFEPDFFDLRTQKLGDILRKFTNYRIKVAIIGDFGIYPSQTLKDFIYESNKFGDYLFVSSLKEVKNKWRL